MKDVIQKRLDSYQCATALEEFNAMSEITQEVTLYALARAGFFQKAIFQGGTCLRIVHGLNRFSEDLDFASRSADETFELAPYLDVVRESMAVYGFCIEISGTDGFDDAVKKRTIKDSSLIRLLSLQHFSDLRKKVRVKIEVDTQPPAGGVAEQKFLDFPVDHAIAAHDMPSLFAGKCHALLCREFVKGRDWYDFGWYIARNIQPNYEFLSSALNQVGPWKGQSPTVDAEWITAQLKHRIDEIDWSAAARDVSRFLRPEEQASLDLWSKEFFTSKLARLARAKP